LSPFGLSVVELFFESFKRRFGLQVCGAALTLVPLDADQDRT
jgi:hypothetical protein